MGSRVKLQIFLLNYEYIQSANLTKKFKVISKSVMLTEVYKPTLLAVLAVPANTCTYLTKKRCSFIHLAGIKVSLSKITLVFSI